VDSGEIAVDLRSVSVNGRRFILNSENITNARSPGNRRTAEFLAGGALVGTILGAIAGGGKGAEVLTRGPALRIPSETILRFRLERPVYLYE
jgi:hypothetical protein